MLSGNCLIAYFRILKDLFVLFVAGLAGLIWLEIDIDSQWMESYSFFEDVPEETFVLHVKKVAL